jgi:2-dehydro-3-deoxyphosphogluconate aldolase / (4S)-4-hydroxy-2-oxoglutarate aldolase
MRVDRMITAEPIVSESDSDLFFEQYLLPRKIIVIVRGLPPGKTVALCESAWNAGITFVEVPVQDDQAVASLRAAVSAARGSDMIVGAGTVTTAARVGEAAKAGARFTVAPSMDLAVAGYSVAAGMPHLGGVTTPAEVQRAVTAGFNWLKLFPAAQLTPGWIRALLAPFPEARFVATGGVNADNAAAFFADGAKAVAIGSAAADPDQLRMLAALAGPGGGTP